MTVSERHPAARMMQYVHDKECAVQSRVFERHPAARMMQWIQVCATGWQCDEWRIGLCYVQDEPRFVLYRAHQRMGEFTALAAAQQRAADLELQAKP